MARVLDRVATACGDPGTREGGVITATAAERALTIGGADLARRPPERAPEAQAHLWSRSAVAWGRYSAWWRGLGDENGVNDAWH